jgi:hypothetical protein
MAHCPSCQSCKQPIFRKGIIVHGNVNVVDVREPDGDGGGFVGSNFPNGAFGRGGMKSEVTFTLDEVKKSYYHWDCFVVMAVQQMAETDEKIDGYLAERS